MMPYRRRRRDILNLTLKTLHVDEEILCTHKTYDNIRERLGIFNKIFPERTYSVIPWNGMRTIRRVA